MALPSGPSEVVIDDTDGPVLDLALDAVNGHMYWTSGVHLWGAFLNGWSPVNFSVQHGVNVGFSRQRMHTHNKHFNVYLQLALSFTVEACHLHIVCRRFQL